MRTLARPLWPSNRTTTTRIYSQVRSSPLSSQHTRNTSSLSPASSSPSSSSPSPASTTPTPAFPPYPSPTLAASQLNPPSPSPPPSLPQPPPLNGHTPETTELPTNGNDEIKKGYDEFLKEKESDSELPKKDPRRRMMVLKKIIPFLETLEKIPEEYIEKIDLQPMLLANGVTLEIADRIMKAGKKAKQFKEAEYNTYIRVVGRLGELERVVEALHQMEAAGYAPDAHAHNGLLYALAAHGKLDPIRAVIESRLSEWPEDRRDEPFGILARYYLRIGKLEEAEAQVAEVEKRGIPIGAGIANALLGYYADQVYETSKSEGRTISAQQMAHIREESGKLVDRVLATRGVQDMSTYFYRAKLMITFGEIAQLDTLLKEVTNSRVKPEARFYNLLAHAHSEKGDVARVAELVAEMRDAGESPDKYTFSTLIKACLYSHDLVGLQQLLETTMNSSEIDEPVPLYNSLMDAFYKLGEHEKSDKILQHMLKNSIQPNVTTYNILLARYFKRREEAQRCLSIFDTMVQSGISPDRTTYDMMMTVYSKLENLQKCREMFDEINKIGRPHVTAFCLLATMYVIRGDHKNALDVIMHARARGHAQLQLLRVEVYAHAAARDPARLNPAYDAFTRESKRLPILVISAYMRGNLQAGNDVCLRILDDATKFNTKLTAHQYRYMSTFLVKHQKWEVLRKLEEHMQQNDPDLVRQAREQFDKEIKRGGSSYPLPPLPPTPSWNPQLPYSTRLVNRFIKPTSPSPSSTSSPSPSPTHSPSTSPSTPTTPSPPRSSPTSSSPSASSFPPSPSLYQEEHEENEINREINEIQKQQQENIQFQKEDKTEEKREERKEEIEGEKIQHHLTQLQQQIQQMQILLQQLQQKRNPENSQNSKISENSQNSQFSLNVQNPPTPLNSALSHLQVTSELSQHLSFNYNQLLHDACARGDLRQCGHLMYHMALAGLRIDTRAYAGLIAAAMMHNNDALAAQVIAEMETHESHTSVNRADICNVILAQWAEKGEFEKCRALLRFMHDSGAQRNSVTDQIVEKIDKNTSEKLGNDK